MEPQEVRSWAAEPYGHGLNLNCSPCCSILRHLILSTFGSSSAECG